jgi:GntR family transcriptional regulator, transcriptional repressor for pyruvate dehydrogenase complex
MSSGEFARAATGLVAGQAGRARRPRTKVTDEIIGSIRADIVAGRLARGARLPNEKDLAQQFSVSQPTIREALRALDVMGLVDVRHGSGAWVRGDSTYLMAAGLQTLLQLEQVGLLDALDVRIFLGRESARLAAEARTGLDLALLDERLDALTAVGSITHVDDVIDAIADFQVALSAASHNALLLSLETFLIHLQLQVQVKVLRARGVKYWQQRSLGFQSDRRAIVEAVRNRDGVAARKTMERYLDHTRDAFAEDPVLMKMSLSDTKAVEVVAAIVLAARDA